METFRDKAMISHQGILSEVVPQLHVLQKDRKYWSDVSLKHMETPEDVVYEKNNYKLWI